MLEHLPWVDPMRAPSPAVRAALLEALHTHGVVRMKARALDPAGMVAFASALGRTEPVEPDAHRLEGTAVLRLQSNMPGVGVAGGGLYWHSDGAWKPEPTALTLLACAVAPPQGGETSFVDARALLDELSPPLRERVSSAVGVYPGRALIRAELEAAGIHDPEYLDSLPDETRHPLARPHPITGAPALLVHQAALTRIDGVTGSESRALLEAVYDAVEGSPSRVRHRWAVNDVLLWDNRAVLHRAEPAPAGATKVTWRALVSSLSGVAGTA